MSRDTGRTASASSGGSSASPSEELLQASAEVARLRRELAEAEARRDALIVRHFSAGSPLASPPASKPAVVIVATPAHQIVRILKEHGLREPFARADIVAVTGLEPRTLIKRIRSALREKLLRRVAYARYAYGSEPGDSRRG